MNTIVVNMSKVKIRNSGQRVQWVGIGKPEEPRARSMEDRLSFGRGGFVGKVSSSQPWRWKDSAGIISLVRGGNPVATGMACNICSVGRGWKHDSDDRTDTCESDELRCEAHDENCV